MEPRSLDQMRQLTGQFTPQVPVYATQDDDELRRKLTMQRDKVMNLARKSAQAAREGEPALLERLKARDQQLQAMGIPTGGTMQEQQRGYPATPSWDRIRRAAQRENVLEMGRQSAIAARKDQEQRQAQQQAAQAPKETKEKVDPVSGDYEREDRMKDSQGNEVIRKKKGNKYQDQYERLLQQQVDQQQRLRLQPLAQLVDQLTGSRMAPGFADPNIAARQDLASRVRAAGQLAQMERGDPGAEFRRKLEERKLGLREREVAAKEAQAKQVKPPKQEDWNKYMKQTGRGEADIVLGDELIGALKDTKDIAETARRAGLPGRAVPILETISRRKGEANIKDLIELLQAKEAYHLQKEKGLSEDYIKENLGELVTARVSEDLENYLRYYQEHRK